MHDVVRSYAAWVSGEPRGGAAAPARRGEQIPSEHRINIVHLVERDDVREFVGRGGAHDRDSQREEDAPEEERHRCRGDCLYVQSKRTVCRCKVKRAVRRWVSGATIGQRCDRGSPEAMRTRSDAHTGCFE